MFEQARQFKVLHKANPLTKSTGTSIPTIFTTSPSTNTPITSTTTTYTLFLGDRTQTNSTTTTTIATTMSITITITTTTTNTTTNTTNTTTNTNTLFLRGGLNSTWDNASKQYLVHLLCFFSYISVCGKELQLKVGIEQRLSYLPLLILLLLVVIVLLLEISHKISLYCNKYCIATTTTTTIIIITITTTAAATTHYKVHFIFFSLNFYMSVYCLCSGLSGSWDSAFGQKLGHLLCFFHTCLSAERNFG